MRGPNPPPIELSDAEREALEQLVRRHTTPQQIALRGRIVLAAASGANNSQIARQEGVTSICPSVAYSLAELCSRELARPATPGSPE